MNPTEPNLAIPYPGLRPFFEEDHLLFFGRHEQANELLMRLEDSAFVAVVGSSGSGKSSLVRAGLLPLLRNGFLFGTDDWKIAVAKPGNEPYQRLAHELAAFREGVSPDDVLTWLRRSDDGLLEAVRQLCGNEESHVLVVVDQFEELFGFRRAGDSARSLQNCASRNEAAAFVAMLLAAARKAGQRLRVMLTMRSDFVGDCEVFLGLPQAISQSQFLVPRLTRSQMEAAITGPSRIRQADFQPFDFQSGLVNTLINEAGDRPDQLPLLQHALMRTWKESDRKVLTEANYTRAGRIEKSLSNDADDAFNQLDADGQRLARHLFLLLCDVSPEGQITRRRPLAQEIMDVARVDCPQIERVIRVFQAEDRNFLLPPSPESIVPSTVLDISHESLLRQWLRLKDWLNDERESAAQYMQLAVVARRYAEGRADLLSKRDLETASQWFDQVRPTVAWGDRYAAGQVEKVHEFLTASREAEAARLDQEEVERQYRERLKEDARKSEELRLKEQAAAAQTLAKEQQAKAQSTRRLLKWVSAVAVFAAAACAAAVSYQFEAHDAQAKAVVAKNDAIKEQGIATANEKRAVTAEKRAVEQKTLAEKTLYTAQVRFAGDALERKEILKAQQYLNDAQWDMRGWEHDYLWHHRFETFEIATFSNTDAVWSASFSPDGKRIVSGGYDKTVKVWDAQSGEPTRSPKGYTASISSVSFSPDGKRIVSGSRDNTLKVWDADTGETLTLEGHTGAVWSVSFSPDGKRIVSGSADNTLKVWDASTGQETLTIKGDTDAVWSVSFSPDGKWIVSGSADNTLKVWNASTGQETLTLKGHTGQVRSASFSPDGKRIVSGSDDNTLKVWDASTGQETLTLKGHTSQVRSVSFSPDGKRIVSGSLDKTLKVWDASTGQETLTLKGHTNAVWSVSFSPDGKQIVSGSFDNTLKVWRAGAGQEILTLEGHTGSVWSVSFSPDGKRIVSGSGERDDRGRPSQILVWDAVTGLPLKPKADDANLLRPDDQNPSHSGDRTVVADGDKLVIKQASTGKILFSGEDIDGVINPRFSPDGKRVVSGCSNGTVKVWLQAARSAPAVAATPSDAIVEPAQPQNQPTPVDASIDLPKPASPRPQRQEHESHAPLLWTITGIATLIAILALTAKRENQAGQSR